MAFTTTQALDSVLMNNLLFRNTANAPISSMYTLYATGRGQTYWSNAVTAANISSLSTVFANNTSTMSSYIHYLNSSIAFVSTVEISTLESQIVSTGISLTTNVGVLNTTVGTFINEELIKFATLSNSLTDQVNAVYTSTMLILRSTVDSQNEVCLSTVESMFYIASTQTESTYYILNSTLQGISSISTQTALIEQVQGLTQSGLSSMSTSMSLADLAYYSTITSEYNSTFQYGILSSFFFTANQISTISSSSASISSVTYLESTITNQMLSTSVGLQVYQISTSISFQLGIQGTNQSTMSSNTVLTSTVNGLGLRVGNLEQTSTSLFSTIYRQLSSFTDPVFNVVFSTISQNTSSIQRQISTLAVSTIQNANNISTLSTNFQNYVLYANGQFSTLNQGMSTLYREFSILTTSSILAGIYDTFIDLEEYTVNLINSTILTTATYQSTLAASTQIITVSTSVSYLNFFTSTIYQSTISSALNQSQLYTSSLISSLYSTGSYFLLSSFDSTIGGKSVEFNSSITTITSTIISSLATQFQSSVLGYLSTPGGLALSSFSTQGYFAISTFNGLGTDALSTQSTLFATTFAQNSTIQGGFFYSTSVVLTSTQNASVGFISTFTGITANFVQSSSQLLTRQETQFQSSMTSYSQRFELITASTNQGVLSATTTATSQMTTTLYTSTTNAYNLFVANMNSQLSTLSLSTLYTEQTITLTGNITQGTMDLATFRNFTVNIRAPLISTNLYRLTYTSNVISNLNYRKGIITVDVSTIGATNVGSNNSQLSFDVYRWGLPTTVFGEVYPTISNADYTAMYEYTILNSIVYTNLLNIYPRVRTFALSIAPTQTYNVFTGVSPPFSPVSNTFWRGTRLNIQWSNYSYFPLNAVGAPPFSPDVIVDVLSNNNSLITRYGPFKMNISSLSFSLPYFTSGPQSNAIKVKTYIAGLGGITSESEVLNVNVFNPQFQTIELLPASSRFLVLGDIQAVGDDRVNKLSGSTTSELSGSALSNTNFGYIPTASLFFAGQGDAYCYATVPASTDWSLSGDFTIEAFIKPNTGGDAFRLENDMRVFSIGWIGNGTSTSGNSPAKLEIASHYYVSGNYIGQNIYVGINGTFYYFVTDTGRVDFSIFFGSWTHVAISRVSNQLQLYLNGVRYGNYTISGTLGSSTDILNIGGVGALDTSFPSNGPSFRKSLNGYLTNLRWINGTGLYNGPNFTPITSALPSITNTRLLLSVDNESLNPPASGNLIADSSGTGKIVTRNAVNSNLIRWIVTEYPSFVTPFGKSNAVDGSATTIMVGAAYKNNPESNARYRLTTSFTNFATNISTIQIQNIPSSSNFMRGSGFGNVEMTSSLLRVINQIGTSTFFSTIFLNSTSTQAFFF
jgi:hypothetical protein